MICQKNLINCTCPDIDARLDSLKDSGASIAVAQAQIGRALKKAEKKPGDLEKSIKEN